MDIVEELHSLEWLCNLKDIDYPPLTDLLSILKVKAPLEMDSVSKWVRKSAKCFHFYMFAKCFEIAINYQSEASSFMDTSHWVSGYIKGIQT